ncbi:transposase [Streptomyces sp. NPDC050287]|uniref:transposase n=1 Tax=Streptomyces sp. NPDC050287 TaxID=3365608 RepID=UPI0037B5326A
MRRVVVHRWTGADAGGPGARAGTPPRPRALHGRLNQGRIDFARLRRALASIPLPRAADGRIVLAADVSPWLRPGATPALTGPSATPLAGARASTRWCRAGCTRSWPRRRQAARPGRQCWTRSGWSPALMSPQ